MKIIYDEKRGCYFIQDNKELAELTFTHQWVLNADKAVPVRVQAILDNIEKHPQVLALVKEVLKEGPVKVEFCLHVLSLIASNASWCSETRTIQIAVDHNNFDIFELLHSFVFEMCNANNKTYVKNLHETATDGNEYAFKMESAEYHTRLRTDELLDIGIRESHWPKPKYDLDRKKISFEDYLARTKIPAVEYHGFSHFGQYVYQFHRSRDIILRKKLSKFQDLLFTEQQHIIHLKLIYIQSLQQELQSKKEQLQAHEAFVESCRRSVKLPDSSEIKRIKDKITAIEREQCQVEARMEAENCLITEAEKAKSRIAMQKCLMAYKKLLDTICTKWEYVPREDIDSIPPLKHKIDELEKQILGLQQNNPEYAKHVPYMQEAEQHLCLCQAVIKDIEEKIVLNEKTITELEEQAKKENERLQMEIKYSKDVEHQANLTTMQLRLLQELYNRKVYDSKIQMEFASLLSFSKTSSDNFAKKKNYKRLFEDYDFIFKRARVLTEMVQQLPFLDSHPKTETGFLGWLSKCWCACPGQRAAGNDANPDARPSTASHNAHPGSRSTQAPFTISKI